MSTLLLVTGVAIILLLAVFLWRGTRSRALRKPRLKTEQPGESGEFSVEFSGELTQPLKQTPRSDSRGRLVLMVRDPHLLYAYWELAGDEGGNIDGGRESHDWVHARPILRVYDITGVNFDGTNANVFFDCDIDEGADYRYIQVPRADREYCVELGKKLPGGRFVGILRSNPVSTPRDCPSDNVDVRWMWIERIYREIDYRTDAYSASIVEEINDRSIKDAD